MISEKARIARLINILKCNYCKELKDNVLMAKGKIYCKECVNKHAPNKPLRFLGVKNHPILTLFYKKCLSFNVKNEEMPLQNYSKNKDKCVNMSLELVHKAAIEVLKAKKRILSLQQTPVPRNQVLCHFSSLSEDADLFLKNTHILFYDRQGLNEIQKKCRLAGATVALFNFKKSKTFRKYILIAAQNDPSHYEQLKTVFKTTNIPIIDVLFFESIFRYGALPCIQGFILLPVKNTPLGDPFPPKLTHFDVARIKAI